MRNRKCNLLVVFASIAVSLSFIVSGCSSKDEGKNIKHEITLKSNKPDNKEKQITEPVEREVFALGTNIQLKVYDGEKDKVVKALDASIERIKEIENRVSVNIKESEICKINKSAGKEAVVVSDDTYVNVKKALDYSILTKGAFDISVYPVVKLWGIGTENARIPSGNEISNALKKVNYEDIVIDTTKKSILLRKEGQGLELGAIAKGYVADEVKKVLLENGISSAFINLGGNVIVIGSKVDGSDWKVGLQNPLNGRGDYLGIVNIVDKNVVTSGGYERYFEKDGVRYHHILDPNTGQPARTGLLSTTIICSKSIDADALSTSTYVLGLEEGLKLIESLDGIEAIMVTEDKKVYTTSGIKEQFKISDTNFKYGNK